MFADGKYPRPVSRLSRRKKIKTSLFNMNYLSRMNNSVERLVEDTDDNGEDRVWCVWEEG